jgi:hypothetical protein
LIKTLLSRKSQVLSGIDVKKKTLLTIAFISVLLVAAVAETQFVYLGKTNPLPDIDPIITIENPQNTTYNVNTITLNFTVASNWGVFLYSIA